MKNIRFYQAEKYNSPNYEKVEDMIYKTAKEKTRDVNFALEQCDDTELVSKLLQSEDWARGTGDFLEDHLILMYEGKRYYRHIESVGTEDDIVFEDMYDPTKKKMIYVTSIVYEPEPEFDENEPDDKYVSQYPLEDILEEFSTYCYDSYDTENESDKKNSYVEFASEDIEDIRKTLTIIGKHVYNQEDGEYVKLIIE